MQFSDLPVWEIVLLRIAAVFLVILAGWIGRRWEMLTADTTTRLSRFIVDIALPALVFHSMLRTVDPDALAHSWHYPLLGAGVILLGQGIGYLTGFFFAPGRKDQTYVFLVAVCNWLYVPLVIMDALYGEAGMGAVLLFNLGIQVYIWTLGVRLLQGGGLGWEAAKRLVSSPGLVATVAGIAMAVAFPGLRRLTDADFAHSSWAMMAGHTAMQAIHVIGSLTIPLSLVLTGSQLGGLGFSHHKPSRPFAGVMLSRLILAPAATLGLLLLAARTGHGLTDIPRTLCVLIAAMPVAISATIFTARYGGDADLTATSVFYTTLASIVTVPLVMHFLPLAFA